MKFAAQTDYQSIEDVEAAYPAAEHIEPVEGGWNVFDTLDEFETWLNQE